MTLRIAIIYDDRPRPETTGTYCLRALAQRDDVAVRHLLPDQLSEATRDEFDLFLNIDDGLRYHLPAALRPAATWVIDTHVDFAWSLEKARRYDLVFAAQRDGAARLRAAGVAHAGWLPLACDPAVHRPHPVTKEYDLCFVGNLLPGERTRLVDRLRREFPAMFVGQRYFDEMARTYSASRIVFNRSLDNDINMRVFEALACGSLLLTNDLAENGLTELCADGVHLATYRDDAELLDKARYYLAHEAEREAIAQRGRTLAHDEHTYRHRMDSILLHFERQAAPARGDAREGTAEEPAREAGQPAPSPDSPRAAHLYFEFARPELLARVPPSAQRVLEVGCGAGRLGESIKARQSAHLTGLELDPRAAALARSRLDRVLVANLDTMENDFAEGEFDCAICGDVLEHLQRPADFLRRLRRWLSPAGRLVASIPNVRHHSVVGSLISGNWTYEPAGLLDRTHLHFYTKADIERMLFRCGYEMLRLDCVPGPGHAEWCGRGRPGEVQLGPLRITGLTPQAAEEFYVYQYLVEAAPRPQSDDGLTSIVVLTFNALEYTRRCLDSVRERTDEAYELIVVDNASTDGTREYLRGCADVRLIENPENRGFPAAANQGLRAAQGRQAVLLNNDTVVTTGWLRRLLDLRQRHARAGLIGPTTSWPECPQQIAAGYERLEDLDLFAWRWGQAHHQQFEKQGELVGFCLLITRELWEHVGLLDESYGLGMCEDKDYSQRAQAAGYECLLAKDAYVHHFGHRSFVSNGINSLELFERNREQFRRRWNTASTPNA